ncbi:MAG: hypothetical protein LBF51_11530 [Zoogloeaceae bacterium]|jgi:hypothetical protein|nr:hypothetical protein [Zoogloeaceae bacterium]
MIARTLLFLGLFALCLGANAEQQEAAPGNAAADGQDKTVKAYFYANTGGDIMDGSAGSYRLELYVEYTDPDSGKHMSVKRLIAQCGSISSGNVFGGDGVRVIDVAICEGSARHADINAQYEGSYWLISEPGELTVRKGWLDEPQEIIVACRMPASDIRAVGEMRF